MTEEMLRRTLAECGGNFSELARRMGMHRFQVHREILKMGASHVVDEVRAELFARHRQPGDRKWWGRGFSKTMRLERERINASRLRGAEYATARATHRAYQVELAKLRAKRGTGA